MVMARRRGQTHHLSGRGLWQRDHGGVFQWQLHDAGEGYNGRRLYRPRVVDGVPAIVRGKVPLVPGKKTPWKGMAWRERNPLYVRCQLNRVMPRVQQNSNEQLPICKATRHSDSCLSSNIYTLIQLGDSVEAMNTLPRLSGQVGEIPAFSSGSNVSPKASLADRNFVQKTAIICNPKVKPEREGKSRKSLKTQAKRGVKDGGPCRNRTCDQVIMSHLL